MVAQGCRSDQGSAEAQVSLGFAYDQSWGVAMDKAEAIKWFHKAAEHGSATAEYSLGIMYSSGVGIPRDDVQAYMWFNLAAAHGDQSAITNRNLVEKAMTPEQLSQAQSMSNAWSQQHPSTAQ